MANMRIFDSALGYFRELAGFGGAALVHNNLDNPRALVVPDISAVPTASVVFGDGAVELRYLRLTINAADDAEAGARLINAQPDCYMLLADQIYNIAASANITRVDIVAIGDTTSGTLAAGECVAEGASEANTITAMRTFTFDSVDVVRQIDITLSQFYSAAAAVATATNFARLHMNGRSYA